MPQKIKNNRERGAAATTIIITTLIVAGILGGLGYGAYRAGLFGTLAEFTIKSIAAIMVGISGMLFKMSSGMFEAIYNSAILSQPMTRGPGATARTVLHGWAIVRDFANMFIVLGFVVIGIATILRIREYEAQKKLVPLIIVALLINFSLLICGIIIDATNITMRYFTQVSGPTGITQPYSNLLKNEEGIKNIEEAVGNVDTDNPNTVINYIQAYSSLALFGVISAMIFFTYGILFLFRYVALMCLVILSPLAFVCSVFPATRSVYENWKKQFIQWAIIGIPAAFFVYLAGHILTYFMQEGIGSGADLAGANLAFWIPTAFLLFAYSLIFLTSATGASAALGLATGAMGYVAGRVKGGARWTGKKGLGLAQESRAGQWIGSKVGRGLEAVNLRARGTTATTEAARNRGVEKDINAITDYDELKKIAESPASTDYRRRRRAAAIDKLRKEGEFNRIASRERANAVNYAVSYGYSRTDFNKVAPELAVHDSKEKSRLIGTGVSPAEVDAEMIANAVKGARHDHLLNYSKETLSNYNVAKSLTPGQVKAYEKGSAAQVAELKKHFAALSAEEATLRASGKNAEADRMIDTAMAIDALS